MPEDARKYLDSEEIPGSSTISRGGMLFVKKSNAKDNWHLHRIHEQACLVRLTVHRLLALFVNENDTIVTYIYWTPSLEYNNSYQDRNKRMNLGRVGD